MTLTLTPYYAQTLEQLAEKCGPDATAAVADVHWSAISGWLMNVPEAGALSNPISAALRAVMLASSSDRASLNYPHHAGLAHDDPLSRFEPEAADEIWVVAFETRSDWEKAGKPCLNRDRIKSTQQYVQACRIAEAKRQKGAV